MIGIMPGEKYEYVLLDERQLPREEQTKFILTSLPAKDMATILDLANAGIHKSVALGWLNIIEKGLVGWNDFKNAQGKIILFDEKTKLDRLPPAIWPELKEAIFAGQQISEDLKKS